MSREPHAAPYPAPPTAPWRLPLIAGWRDDAAPLSHGFVSDDASGLTAGERHAAALRVATLNGNRALAGTYRALAKSAPPSPRVVAILRYVDRFTDDPRAIRCTDLRALEAAGLSIADVTALTRLVAFVTYQARLLGALNLIERDT